MQWILVGLFIVVSGLLCVFNWQPITLYFLGNSSKTAFMTVSLPLAVWIILFTFNGILTGLILQILNRFSSPPSSPRRPRQWSEPPSAPSPPNPPLREPDWERPVPKEWDIEEPPRNVVNPLPNPPETPQPEIKDSFTAESSTFQPKSSEFEAPQQPLSSSRKGSVYTYRYQDKDKTSATRRSPSSSVYDADYRVIQPPSPESENTELSEENKEEWI